MSASDTAAAEGRQTIEGADFLLDTRGTSRDLDAWVAAAAFARDGRTLAFALADGTLHAPLLSEPDAPWRKHDAHDGAALALVPDGLSGLLSGGDDGRLLHLTHDGLLSEVRSFGAMKWVEHLATHPTGLRAVAVGKHVHLLDAAGTLLKTLGPHPSTVGGVALDAKGKRVFATHYNGVSSWFVGAKEDRPRILEWKGSHHAIAVAPDGGAVVSAMQESALHGWRLADGQHMRMSGYPSKTHALSFTAKGRWLATSGADSVVLWPFHGGGPMGKAPTELAGGDGVLCTRVACHPQHEIVAAGFTDGLVLLAEVGSGKVVPVAAPGRGPVSALAWNATGSALAFGTETGFAALVDLSKR